MSSDVKRKSRAYGIRNPLQKLGPLPVVAQRNPLAADIGYSIGTDWINESTNNIWTLTSIAAGAANWEPVSQSAGGNAPISKFIVDPDGTADYTTIQTAIDAANAAGGGTVYVRPGTYTESLTLYDAVDVVGATASPLAQKVIIVGVHTPPLTGYVSFCAIDFQSATDIFNSAAAGASSITLVRCVVEITNGYIFNLLNWTAPATFTISQCYDSSVDNGVMTNTGGVPIFIFESTVGDGTGNTMTCSSSSFIQNSGIRCPSVFTGLTFIHDFYNTYFLEDITVSSTGFGRFYSCIFTDATLTTADTASNFLLNCVMTNDVKEAISHGSGNSLIVQMTSISGSNNPIIDGVGAGVLQLLGVEFGIDDHINPALTTSAQGVFASAHVMSPLGRNLGLRCGDAAGANQVEIEDSTGTPVAAITSLGDAGFNQMDVTLNTQTRQVDIDGDAGVGIAATVGLTNVYDEALGAGIGTVLMKTANPANSSGWLKIYANANVRYIPYWTTISP